MVDQTTQTVGNASRPNRRRGVLLICGLAALVAAIALIVWLVRSHESGEARTYRLLSAYKPGTSWKYSHESSEGSGKPSYWEEVSRLTELTSSQAVVEITSTRKDQTGNPVVRTERTVLQARAS